MVILDGKLDVTTQEGYDIACALRGPDLAMLHNLKFVLTGRLRGLVAVDSTSGGIVADSPNLVGIEFAREEWEHFYKQMEGGGDPWILIRSAISHWAWHLVAAYNVLLGIEHTEELELLLAIAQALESPGLKEGVVKALEAYATYIKEHHSDPL